MPHVRICAGGGPQGPSLPRPLTRVAAAQHQPAGLALAGLLLSLAACGLWVITSIGVLNTTESLLVIHGK
jgi:hypothetical protein